ncbi:hypothetical protein V5799_019683 [Amblyomma americanum]|uniref:Zinc finger CCCH domain-containing protein 3 n=1 Tax=Amblyomma americanum TaxID=6943 RepID=A0AAQ4EW90_AMBAM
MAQTDHEKKALQDEISYLSRLIDSHHFLTKTQESTQIGSLSRYKKVNAPVTRARSAVCSGGRFTNVLKVDPHCSTRSTENVGSQDSSIVRNTFGLQRTPQPRSRSTVVHKSRYTLTKLHARPNTTEKPELKPGILEARKLLSVPPATVTCTALSCHTSFKRPPSGRYVYRRKSETNGTACSNGRFGTAPSNPSMKSPRPLVSTYRLIRNRAKAATPIKSPSSNLTRLGARRIVKKYKLNNVNKSRTSLQRPQRSQFERCAAMSGMKRFWPPSYSSTHYFHGQKRKMTGKSSTDLNTTHSHYIKIGNITYKASRNKLSREFRRSLSQSPVACKASPCHERIITVRGSVYTMDKTGKVLRRISQPRRNSFASGLARIDVGGQTYIEQKPGVLSQTPSAETRTYLSRAVNRSIQRVRTVNTSRRLQWKSYCIFFNRFGRCNKGDSCGYIHDPEKVAVCTRYLRGTCKVSDCQFSHKVAPEKMPVCSFFLKGRCTNNPCPYRHVKVSSKAEVCQDFAVRGYCADGIKVRVF